MFLTEYLTWEAGRAAESTSGEGLPFYFHARKHYTLAVTNTATELYLLSSKDVKLDAVVQLLSQRLGG